MNGVRGGAAEMVWGGVGESGECARDGESRDDEEGREGRHLG